MSGNYILDDTGNPVLCNDILAWGRWFETADRTVEKTQIGDVLVSTAFLSLDHRWDVSGMPVLYETMIFGGQHSDYQERYTTREEAVEGHRRAVALVTGAAWPDA